MENAKLSGKIAVVTGGSKGLGKVIGQQLAAAGAIVIINYNHSQADAEKIVSEINNHGGKAYAIQADVSKEADVARIYQQINGHAGTVDILINNAGINPSKSLSELTLQDFQLSLNVNLISAFLMTQAALPAMMEKNFGRIINITSVAAQHGGVSGPHYGAAKAGMIGLTHSYAAILAKFGGITSNAIAPALIETDMIKNNPAVKPTLIPLGRFGRPEEVADIVLLLATNGYINGQTINVNGGWYMS